MTPIHLPMSKKKTMSRKVIYPDSIIYSKHRCLSHKSLWNKQMVTSHETKWSIPTSQVKKTTSSKHQGGKSGFPYPEFLYRAHQQGSRSKRNPVQARGARQALSWSPGTVLAVSCVRVRHNLLLALTSVSNLQRSTDPALLTANYGTPHAH